MNSDPRDMTAAAPGAASRWTPATTAREAITSRRSIREFDDRPVPGDVIRRVLADASRAPSGGNLQPWHLHVVAGEPMARLKAIMLERIESAPFPNGEGAEYDVYPKEMATLYRDRRFKIGEDMYARLGIPREDKAARMRWFLRNFQFFGAPMGLFCSVDRRMGPPQWSDLGMFLQNVMVLLRAEGLDSCPQECWAMYPQTIGTFLSIPAERMLFTGMAIGYAKAGSKVNELVAARAPVDEIVVFIGV
jgi:nitroreductase